MRPTEEAQVRFNQVSNFAFMMKTGTLDPPPPIYWQQLAVSIEGLAEGLSHMCIGLRATYILLEEVKKQLERQNLQSGRR